jgi:nucleoside-diphosphate-sugar epimerase
MVSPRTVRDFVFIDDVVDVYLMVDKLKALRGDIINVGTGVQHTLAQVLEAMESVIGRKLNARWGKMPSRTWDADVWVADVSKLYSLTGYTPRTTIKEGLAKSLPWFRENARVYAGKEARG